MLVTLLPSVTRVRLLQARNAESPMLSDAFRDRDAGQAGAVREHRVPDAGDAVADRDTGQAAAVSERRGPMLVTLLPIVTLVRLLQERTPSPRCW